MCVDMSEAFVKYLWMIVYDKSSMGQNMYALLVKWSLSEMIKCTLDAMITCAMDAMVICTLDEMIKCTLADMFKYI